MSKDPIRGKTLSFTFDDGPMAGKTFEHRFANDGTVTFHALGGQPDRGPGTKYEVAPVRDDVCAVSYLSSAGYTLTVVLDFATMKLVAFSSNGNMLALQRGSFDETQPAAESKLRNGIYPHAPRH
jgi:hypothetical protein